MTDVEVYEAPAASELEQWARDLNTAYQAAVRLVTTSFVPSSYSGKPEEAAAAILTGQELGMSPLSALRSIDIIQGTPAMRAVALRALVQSEGHEIWTEESTATQAIVCGRRKGSDKVERSVWTMDRARGLGLVSKDNWRKQPIAMLLARATSELVRLIAADKLLGIPYSVEELTDAAEAAAVEEAPRKAPAARTVKRKPLDELPPMPTEPELPAEQEQQPADPEPAPAQAAVQPVEPFEGDPLSPTKEELDEWASLPADGDR